jgi:(S)-3,5-dihydroxyphenylglycine transaminase
MMAEYESESVLPLTVGLDKRSLHACLSDPILDSINFLNEVMDRFPDAISFAPGAPNPTFFEDIDVIKALDTFVNYLSREKKLEPAQIRRVLYQYGPSRGQINDLVAGMLQKDEGISVSPQAVVIAAGCQEAMILVLRALCASSEDLVAIVNPCFVGFAGAARVLGLNTVSVAEKDEGIDFGHLDNICRSARAGGKRVRLLYVAPDYSNPSGTLLDLETRLRLLKTATRENFFLVEDNAYGFTAAPKAALPTLKALDDSYRVIYLGTFAKICFPGARVGFVVADQPVRHENGNMGILADELATIKSMITVNTSPICQAIIGGMLLEHECSVKSLADKKSKLYRQNLQLLLDALNRHLGSGSAFPYQVAWNTPHGGFFVRLRLPYRVDNDLLKVSAERYGVLWTPMTQFYLDGVPSNELRLSCSYLSPDKIEEGVRRLSLFLRDPCIFESCG